MAELLKVDVEEWRDEVASIREHYVQFAVTCPSS